VRRAISCAILLAMPAAAQDGRLVFERYCASCHAVVWDAPQMAGPNLHGVLGRRVAGDAGFDYSPVLREAGQTGDTWNAARLDRFLEDPEVMYLGLWMGGNGLRAAVDRLAVVEWLASASARSR
jgi:cytochrome c